MLEKIPTAPVAIRVCQDVPSDNENLTIEKINPDIWVCALQAGIPMRNQIYVESTDHVLTVVFRVPRIGKGGDDGGTLPAGSMYMFPPGRHVLPKLGGRGLVLCVMRSRLRCFLGAAGSGFFDEARTLLAKQPGRPKTLRFPLTPEQIFAGNAFLTCPYIGVVRSMFYKAKMFELLALFFNNVQSRGNAGLSVLPLFERDALVKAREYYLRDIAASPGIREVARHVGMSEAKFKRLFKEAYGMPPFSFLKAERLALARELILEGKGNVSEVAGRVGYTNISHFISAFVQRYNVRPGELLERLT